MKKLIYIILLMLPIIALAAAPPAFVEGKDYKPVTLSTSNPTRLTVPENKVLVVEFFSYGCPWCYHLEPALEQWLKNKPATVEFERVPLAFEQGWDTYSKAYYTAQTLGILNKITPALFNAIHVKNEDLTSESAMQKFFASQGVSEKDFQSAFDFSPGIGMELQRGMNLMVAYQIFTIPTIVVDGKYYTNAQLANGDDHRLIQIVNYLIAKEKPKGAG